MLYETSDLWKRNSCHIHHMNEDIVSSMDCSMFTQADFEYDLYSTQHNEEISVPCELANAA